MPGSICGRSYFLEDAEAAHFYHCSEGLNKGIVQDVSQLSEVGSLSYRCPCTVSIAATKFYRDEQSMSS